MKCKDCKYHTGRRKGTKKDYISNLGRWIGLCNENPHNKFTTEENYTCEKGESK